MPQLESPNPMLIALRRLAGAEPDLGSARSGNWHERVLALRDLRAAVASHARAERSRGMPIERVIIAVKELVTQTLRAERPEMEVAPIREKVVAWCSAAYFGSDETEV
jgi:hypothetical protein